MFRVPGFGWGFFYIFIQNKKEVFMDFKKVIMFLFALLMLVGCAGTQDNSDETRARANEAYQEVDAE